VKVPLRACNSLTSIILPSVTTIENGTFSSCSRLATITIPTSVTSVGDNAFYNCISIKSMSIPSPVSYIGNKAFFGCNNLTSINIPALVTLIGNSAFSGCSSMNSIYAYSNSPTTLGSDVFLNVNKNTCVLYVPIGSKSEYLSANQWKDFNNVVEFSTTDVEQIKSNEISLYPNPVTDGFRVNGINGMSALRLSDINGKLILTKEINKQ